MADRSPQEKKELSYKKDRRNAYGENSKSSRRAIPFQKAAAERANRKAAKQALHAPEALTDEARQDAADAKLNGKKLRRWTKVADIPLGEFVEGRLSRRAHVDPKLKKK
jgi:hypothetical protein